MESYATKQATIDALISLNFIPISDTCLDSPGEDPFGGPMIQVDIYKCRNGYWCVAANGFEVSGFSAPIVWNKPGQVDDGWSLQNFLNWCDEHNPGWR